MKNTRVKYLGQSEYGKEDSYDVQHEVFQYEEFKSKVWTALEGVASEFPEISDELHKDCMEKAIEWFMTHFYNEL